MMRFSNMENFHLGYQFFMNKPSNAGRNFIFMVAALLFAAFIWANIAKMDDIVRATAILRPAQTISTVRPLVGGQVQMIGYAHNEFVAKGDLLLLVDTTADVLELRNSIELAARIDNNIKVQTSLLETIRDGINAASSDNEEAHIHSESFIIENQRQLLQIEEIRIRLEIERNLHEMLVVRERINEIERELERSKLQFLLWRNNRIVETTDILRNLIQHRENIERRKSDLERNINNSTIYATISGRVNELRRLNIGDNIVAGEEILTIIPEDETGLKAELFIEPAFIARVIPGQKAVLRFPGLPPSRYGKLEAEINLIPPDFTLLHGASPVFIVEAELPEPWLESRRGDRIYLRAGISASGRIIVDRDTVFRMILRKLDFINENYEQRILARAN